jgi:hypothetical protein
MVDMAVWTRSLTFFVMLAACGSSGDEAKTLFSDGFDTYPSSQWVQVSATAPTLDPTAGSPAPSLAFGDTDTYLQTALVGPFPTHNTTFSMDVSIDSISASGRACILLSAQGDGSINFGLDLEVNGGKFYDGVGGGCTLNNAGGLVATATAGFHTIALAFDASGTETATLDGTQIATGGGSTHDNMVLEIDGQDVHLDNILITAP